MTQRNTTKSVCLATGFKVLFLLVTLTLVPLGHAADQESSRLRYSIPEQWERKVNSNTQIVSLTAPGGNASVAFLASEKFAGSAEAWLQDNWNEVLKSMTLAKPETSGVQGQFITRMSALTRLDGSKPWICLYALVKNGRGEGVVYYAANSELFLTHLGAVNAMVNGITVSDTPDQPSNTARDDTSRLPGLAKNTPATPAPDPVKSRDSVPVLGHNEPANFFRSGGTSPIEYSSTEVNCSLLLYAFQPYSGDIRAMFKQTMLRDWIDPRYREGRLVAAPQFSTKSVPGAGAVLTARFHESPVGIPNERLRVLIVAGSDAAIVDVVAIDAYCWQKAGPIRECDA